MFLHLARLGARALTHQAHHAVFEASLEHQRTAGVIDPRLVPDASRRVVEIDAVATETAGPLPVLEERAAVENAFDPVGTSDLAFLGDLPLAEPEIELMVGVASAWSRLLGSRLRCGLFRERCFHGDDDPQDCDQDSRFLAQALLPCARNCALAA